MIADETAALRSLVRLATAWNTVKSGLWAMRMATIIAIAAVLSVVLLVVLSHAVAGDRGANRKAEAFSEIIVILGALTGLLATILFVVGQCRCCAVPQESRAKGLAVASVICLFSSLALGVVGFTFLIVISGEPADLHNTGIAFMAATLIGLAGVIRITSHILVVMCLRALARYFGNEQLTSSAGTYLILSVVFLMCCTLTPLVIAFVGNTHQSREPPVAFGMLVLVLALGLIVYALFVVLYFVELLARTRRTIVRLSRGNSDA